MWDASGIVILVGFFVVMPIIFFCGRVYHRKKMSTAGYESLLKSWNNYEFFYEKDGEIFFSQNYKPRKAKLIEVIGVSEITRNSHLVELEIRFRMDGAITSRRVKGKTDQLLTLEDRLGFGG